MVSKDNAYWQDKLTPHQYAICRERGTERAFTGEYWDCFEDGSYRCRCCHSLLFHAASKYEVGSGWPTFYRPASDEAIREVHDSRHGMRRTEVQCSACHCHLGHVFNDGPPPTGRRYSVNSAAIVLEAASTQQDWCKEN